MQWCRRPRFVSVSVLHITIVAVLGSFALAVCQRPAAADESAKRAATAALDLPSGVATKLDLPEDPRPPLATITILGQEYTARSFVFCIERSWDLACWNNWIRNAVYGAIRSLPERSEFSIVYYTQGAQCFSSAPLPASEENVAQAGAWLFSFHAPAVDTCMLEGAVAALNNGNCSQCPDQSLIMFTTSDLGGATSTLTCDAIEAANWRRNPIHIIEPAPIVPGQNTLTSNWLNVLVESTGGSIFQLPLIPFD